MPRVHGLKRNYMEQDLREWILGRMKGMKKSQEAMGEKMNITQVAFSRRLKEMNFTWRQLLIIFRELEASDEVILKFMKL